MCCEDGEEGEDDGEDVEDGEDLEEEEDEQMEEEDTPVGKAEAVVGGSTASDPNVRALADMVEEFGIDTLYPPLDGTAFYTMICRINHSCEPNVRVTYVSCPQRGLLATLIALRPIGPGEELVQSYIDQFQGYEARKKALSDYGFVCSCSKCVIESGALKTVAV